MTKRGAEISVLHLDSTLSLSEVQADMGVLATQAIPLEFRPWEGGAELPGLPSVEQQFVDLVFSVGEHKFFCHRPVFLARSEYFQVLLEDHFNEATEDEEFHLTTINLNQVTPEVFSSVSKVKAVQGQGAWMLGQLTSVMGISERLQEDAGRLEDLRR